MATAHRLQQFWEARATRERRILVAGAALLALLAFYLLLVEPAASGASRLHRQLPQLRARAAELDTLVTQARELRKLPAAAVPLGTDARAALDKSLVTAGLTAAHSETLPNGDLRLTFAAVPYGKWAGWLASSERTMGVHTVAAQIRSSAADSPAGSTDIELTLRLSRAGS